MNPFHRYLSERLQEKLQQHTVVVFYDPEREFEAFVDELPSVGNGHQGVHEVTLGDRRVHLARYRGSFFGLRAAVEPVTSGARPEQTLLYLPGVEWSPDGSPLLELERAGTYYRPRLNRMARYALQKYFSEGDVDRTLEAEGLDTVFARHKRWSAGVRSAVEACRPLGSRWA
mgnify:CR=1 FL=1